MTGDSATSGNGLVAEILRGNSVSQPGADRPKATVLMPMATFEMQFLPSQLERLRALCELVDPSPVEALEDFRSHSDSDKIQVVITGWGAPPLSDDVLAHYPKLALIAHCAGSLKQIVDPRILSRGIRITTSALANAQPVAEYTLAYILRWNKRLDVFEAGYRQERDRFSAEALHRERNLGNTGRSVGIVGASRVGRSLMNLLAPFDLDVLLTDPMVSSDETAGLGASKVSLSDLMRLSDIVSVNAPLLPETEGMIGREQLALMRDGSLLINTARGHVIDQDALIDQLKTGRISAVLDVTDPEPLPASSPLYDLNNVVLTPHVAGSLGREIHRMTALTLSEIELFFHEARLEHEIRADDWSTRA
ncbi:MAG: hydroxyacid dehydrogenase [Hyphomicrobiales bacterium]|nr:hydroxyacid dehydrogenase [Hyphomicrobiales bacterium]